MRSGNLRPKTESVVVVNDDLTQLRILSELLKKERLKVDSCESASEALSVMDADNPPDLIVTDLHMPGIDGWRFCRLLRSPEYKAFNQIPVLVVSATFSGAEASHITAELGANAFLPSPVSGQHFLDHVRSLLAGETPRVSASVLIVDDSRAICGVLARAFEAHGYDVRTAPTGTAGRDLFSAEPSDIVLLDYHLPDMLGDHLLKEIKRNHPLTTVVMITTDPDAQLAVEWMKNGASAYVRKPFDPEYLISLCQKAGRERSLLHVENILEERTRELRESEERFRALFHNAPLSYQSLQADGDLLEVNDTWCETLGYGREEVIGRNFTDFLAPGFVEHFLYNFPCFKEDGQIHGVEFEMVRKDGGHINVVFEGRIGHNPDGTFKRTHCILQDVTERKRAEEKERNLEVQMQQTQKLESLGVMAGGIAHDFNNILFAILGNADLALGSMPPVAAGRKNLHEILKAARRASELTDQMLAYSGRGTLASERFDLSELVKEMAHLLEVSHTKKAILRYRFAQTLPAIKGDPSQLRQVVMNLITNASEAVGDEAGIITVETGVTEATREYLATTYVNDELSGGLYVYLQVTDTGCGMDDEAQRRIFEPFFTTKFTGRGLGMAATMGIVRAHKAAIDIQSEVGHGTTVRVLFPALDAPAKPHREEVPPEEDWIARGTVLVVDDEPQIRSVTKTVLERKGFTVLTAVDGHNAANVFREHKDDMVCVLLDLTMPRMGGEETFVKLHQIRDDVPIVLVSGYSEEQLRERVEIVGFAGFLKKPVQSRELLSKVRTVLSG